MEKLLKELSVEGILNVLSNYRDVKSLKGKSKDIVEVVALHYLMTDEIDEIEFIIELNGE